MEADIAAADRDERIGLMEPLVVGESYPHRSRLADLAFDLTHKSASLRSRLPEKHVDALAALVRCLNCYYSNLIEGHNTHPIEIERALSKDYSHDPKRRELQLEAQAHIAVQQWIDTGGLSATQAITRDGIREIHHRFCNARPPELLWVESPGTHERLPLIPGQLRDRNVQVGQHIPVSPGALPRFLAHFERTYSRLGKAESVIAAAAIHHRLLWIHPFLDGNGRVARLVSHAQLRDLLDTGAVWSIARGLARNVQQYKLKLAECDQPRRNHLDGRGSLSQEALGAFTEFFLTTCIDQVNFMEGLMQPAKLQTRIQLWAEEQIRLGKLPGKADLILNAILYRGELQRREADAVVQTGERQARRIVSALLESGAIASDSPRAPLRLAFPATLASRWMPGLFPDYTEEA